MTADAPLAVCAVGDRAEGRVRALGPDLPRATRLVTAGALDDAMDAIRALEPAGDVLLVTGDAVPTSGWWERLAEAAAGDAAVATVSASAGGEADAPLVLLRAPALALCGLAADGLESAAALAADFSERATAHGFRHAHVDGLLLSGAADASSAAEVNELGRRWPHRTHAPQAETRRPRPRAGPIGVTIDVRSVTSLAGGTQIHALELVAALARTGQLQLRAIVPPDLDPLAAAAFERLDLQVLAYEQAASRPTDVTDIVHRPNQVSTTDDLRLLLPLGRRLVITQQDLLTYRIPDYNPTPIEWLAHREATREALAVADRVVFLSQYVREQAVDEELVLADRTSVVPIGTDHAEVHAPASRRPAAVPPGASFLLCLGSDLRHKNRLFARRLFAALRAHGWAGRLVFAGPHVAQGSSRAEEQAWSDPDGGEVIDLGVVGPAERRWLLEEAAAVLYPSVTEGFGLLPFEAASAGVPCLFASQGSLGELLPRELAVLVPWDADASARRALPLLSATEARKGHVGAVREVAATLTWDACADALLDVYERTVASPSWPAAMLSRKLRRAELEAARLEEMLHAEGARHAALIDALGEHGMQLVGPGGVVSPEEREPLLAFMHHQRLARAVLSGFAHARRISRALRRN